MNFMNRDASVKQFELLRFINENSDDDHVMSKITILLRRDKIEAPYYMETKVKLSSCIDMPENGLIHAMDVMSHARRYNLTEDKYNEIKSLICDAFANADESGSVKITRKDKRFKVVVMTRNDEEFRNLLNDCSNLFDAMDAIVGQDL